MAPPDDFALMIFDAATPKHDFTLMQTKQQMPGQFGTRDANQANSPQIHKTHQFAPPEYRPSWRRTGKCYDSLFQEYIISLVRSGRTPVDVAAEIGIPASTIRGWVAHYSDPIYCRPEDLELQLLRQDLEHIQHQRDLFREAADILSKEKPAQLELQLLQIELTSVGRQRDAYMAAVGILSATLNPAGKP